MTNSTRAWGPTRAPSYEEAISHFQQAVSLDPALVNARLYLATALANQYIPGVDAEDNNRIGQQAIDEYEKVLAANPSRDQKITSLKGIASLYFNMKKLDQAKTSEPQSGRSGSLGPGFVLLDRQWWTGPRPTSRAWKNAPSWA